jgi:flagellar basal-body rod modification protein FlgD
VADGISVKSSLESDPLTRVNSKYSSSTIDTTKGSEDSSYMDFDSYLKVLVAQMQNQDFNNPMSDSEFMAQMASYSQLEAVKNMTNQANLQYATGLTGKAVTVNDGTNYDMGLVDSVVVEDGKPKLLINGNAYDPSMVTDVVSDNLFMIMQSLKGLEVTYDTTDASGKGIVTGGLVAGGEQYLVLDGKDVFPLSAITLPSGDNAEEAVTDADQNGENTVNPTEPADPTESSENDPTNATGETDPIEETTPAEGTDSEQLSVGGTENAAATDGANTDNTDESSLAAADEEAELIEVVRQADENPANAGFSDDNNALRTFSSNATKLPANADDDDVINSISNVDINPYKESVGIPTTPSSESGILSEATPETQLSSNLNTSIPEYTQGVNIPIYTGAYGYQNYNNPVDEEVPVSNNSDVMNTYGYDRLLKPHRGGTVTVESNSPYENTVYTDQNPGQTYRNSPYFRRYGDEYPEEAALADAYGTRMFDIRYINNREICNRINTSEVIGTTSSGRAFTDLGFSGTGNLGEVVTFADGTQRVEIIMEDGGSGWHHTTGRFSINQKLYEQNPEVQAQFTPFEMAIRHYGLTGANDLP